MKKLRLAVSNICQKAVVVTALLAAPAVSGFFATELFANQTLISAGSVQAATPMQPATAKLDPRRLPGLGQSFVKKLQAAAIVFEPEEDSGEEGDPQRALQMLDVMARKMEDYNPYEQVMVHTYYGAIYYGLENMPKSIEHFEKLISLSPNLPRGSEAQYIYTLGQLYFQEDQSQKALDYFVRWSKLVKSITATQYSMVANVYYQAGKVDDGLVNMLEAIKMFEEKGKVPKEEWFSFARAIYFRQENRVAALDMIEKLIRHYPKMSYWRQLSGIYYELGRVEDYYRALDSMYVMGGLKKEAELLSLAGGFLDKETPYPAAVVLDKGINKDKIIKPSSKNLELLANSWRLAQETDKALIEMQKAARSSDDGDLYFNLSRLLFASDRYGDSITAAKRALAKGGLKRPDTVHLTIGQAELERGNFDAAVKAFAQAAKDERSLRHATSWTKYAESEKMRIENLKS